jgi:hypothetical protein
MEEERAITLVSNASLSKSMYQTNTVARFKTRLFEAVELQGEYEIALKEIQFPISFYNVSDGDYTVDVLLNLRPPNDENLTTVHGNPTVLSIPKGYYSNVQHILHQLNNINLVSQNVQFKYNQLIGRVEVVQSGALRINLSPKLRAILGFNTTGEEYIAEGTAPNPVNLNANVPNQLYVHCDVVEPQLIGHSTERLLQTVGIEDVGKFGRLFVQSFDNPEYVPLLKTHFHTIEIDIRSCDRALPAPFEYGPSVVKVHIRRKRRR